VIEFLDRRKIRNFIELNLFTNWVHDFGEFNRIPAIFRQVFFQEKENELTGVGYMPFWNILMNRGESWNP